MTKPNERAEDAAEPGPKPTPWWVEIPAIILLTCIILSVFQNVVGRLYVIPSASMEPTLHGCEGCTGDRIFVENVSYYFSDPEPGDVVVFRGPESWNGQWVSHRSDNAVVSALQTVGSVLGFADPDENNLVKRVVAGPGQVVSCQAGDPAVMVDGEPTDQSFVLDPPQYAAGSSGGSNACGGEYFGPVQVPEGNVFVMGDNRTGSADSRAHLGDEFQGTVPIDNIKGRVVAKVWPPSRIGGVGHVDLQPQR